ALGDVEGDGDLDIIEGNSGQPNRVWLNDGTGTFADSGQLLGSSDTTSVALGDLDGDGDLDIVEGNFGQPNRIWLNQ
ncbi:MAG: VCBS repeat-containing protein, partial [Deltaproteobacteria bacterium]|nr:VCBS repeat-containing protein [Deltaproteobacteria bacterium]